MAESTRRRLERDEDQRLAPFATRSTGASRRHPLEDRGRGFDYRTDFQRDRDRIVYSRAFRRLRQKAQTGILPAYEDHRRNRLTHTLEVAQVARTVARALRLNEDLTEAIALAHDLGQPPFGQAGERVLDDLLSGRLDGRGGPGLGDVGGFDRAWQALRVVDLLEKRYDHPGLNLTDEVRDGILKPFPWPRTPWGAIEGIRKGDPPSYEARVVALSDRIASALHDLDDALQSGAVDVAQVERLRAVRELRRKLGPGYPPRGGRFIKANAIHRGLTHLLVTGAILGASASLERWHEGEGRTLEIGLPDPVARLLEDLEGFLVARVHRGHRADQVEAIGRRVVFGLFAAYHADPAHLEDHVLIRFRETAGVRYLRDVTPEERELEFARSYRNDERFARLVADYLAGMTDAYASAEHQRLLAMGAVPIPSAEQLRREGLE